MATLATIRGEVKRLLADLDERAYAQATADGVTTAFPLPDQNIVGKTSILAATALIGVAQDITTDLINPPYAKILYVQGNAPGIAGNVVITGTDYQGDAATDTIALSGATAVAGTVKFKTVTQVTLPVETHAKTDTVKVYAAHSVSCTVDSVAETGFILDFDSGWVEFTAAPAADSTIIWSYHYSQYNNADILSAVNAAVADVWAEIPKTTLDTSTIAASSGTYEYALPSDCARLVRVDKRATANSPYEKEHNWRVVEDGATRYLYLFSAPTSGETVRLHYVSEPTFFSSDTDTMATARLPERSKWAIIYLACFYLCEQKLLPRARTNQFKNAEGANVPKVYEIQRIAADFRSLAELEMRKLRLGPKRF